MAEQKICAIIVTFNPVLQELNELVQSLLRQVQHILIIDNSEPSQLQEWVQEHFISPAIELISLNKNVGIAAAYNVGIEWVKKQSFQFVLLMDQDSSAAADMVSSLLITY